MRERSIYGVWKVARRFFEGGRAFFRRLVVGICGVERSFVVLHSRGILMRNDIKLLARTISFARRQSAVESCVPHRIHTKRRFARPETALRRV